MSLLSIAPMIDWTFSPFRIFMRILAPKALLYTEMQTVGAVLNNTAAALFYTPKELPLALQLGGSDPQALAQCARLGENFGYSEINLNLGCPSNKVQAGQFGACLMRAPQKVAQSIRAMKANTIVPISAKLRIGIDKQDDYPFFAQFAQTVLDAGCDKLIIHARKAWLQGLSPKQNRMIPPLHYDYVYRLKQSYPHIPIIINGNISRTDLRVHVNQVDGVMIGRTAYENPYQIALIHHDLYPHVPLLTRKEIVQQYYLYLENIKEIFPVSFLLKPLFNLAHGIAHAKQWKHILQKAQQQRCLPVLCDLENFLDSVEAHIA